MFLSRVTQTLKQFPSHPSNKKVSTAKKTGPVIDNMYTGLLRNVSFQLPKLSKPSLLNVRKCPTCPQMIQNRLRTRMPFKEE